jgi:hypothetical protein
VGFSRVYFNPGLAYVRSRVTTVETVGQLREEFSGQVLAPGETGYDESRRIHNGLIE